MKNKTFAMEAAPSAIPPKPNMAAIIAMIKKITDQRSIIQVFKFTKEDLAGSSTAGWYNDVLCLRVKSLYQV